MEIFFGDLKRGVQVEVLKFYKVKNPMDMNWDIFPLFVLEREEGLRPDQGEGRRKR